MRRWLGVSILLLVLGGALGWRLLSPDDGAHLESAVDAPGQEARTQGTTGLLAPLLALPAPPPRGDLSIQGQVLGPEGPVPGAVVAAVKAGPLLAARVLAPCGCHPVAGSAEVECSCEADPARLERWLDMLREETPPLALATTDAQGHFALVGLEAGSFQLWAEGAPGIAQRPDVTAGTRDVELRLGDGATLDIAVLDEEGAPVAEAHVAAPSFAHGRLFEGLTGPEGRLRMGPVPPGEYYVLTQREGWFPELLRMRATREHPVAVSLSRARGLKGRVVDGDAPVRGASVTLAGEHRELKAETDGEGRFAFEGLRPETYEVLAFHGERQAAAALLLRAGLDAPDVVLDLSRPSQARGVVRDEEGRPLQEVVLKVAERSGPRLQRRKVLALTGADGAYALGPLPEGEYVIQALGEGFLPEKGDWSSGDGPLDFTLKRALLVKGVVMDARGRPLADAILRLLDTERDGERPHEVALAKTGADGTFQLEVDRAGDFLLAAYHPDFLMAKQRVTVPRPGVRMVLSDGAALTGEVLDSRGLPVAEAEVWARPAEAGDPVALPHRSITDERGRFREPGMAAGRYKVEVSQGDDADFQGVETVVEVKPPSSHVRLVLPPGLPLAGVVVDTAGRPLSGVLLLLHLLDPVDPAAGASGSSRVRTVTTGQDGRFRLQSLAPGSYAADAIKPGYLAMDATAAPREGSRRERFLVSAGKEDVRWVLRRGAEARGRVTREDGSPVTRFRIDGLDVADPEGRFARSLYDGSSARFTLTAPDLAPTSLSVTARGEDGDVDLGTVVMRAGLSLRGRLVDAATGAPVPGALVAVEDGPATATGKAYLSLERGAVKSAADGTFVLPHVEEGRRTLIVTRAGYVQKRLALAPGQTQAQVGLDTGAWVRGTVRASRSYRLCIATLQAEDGSFQHEAEFPCTHFETRGVPAGAYVASLFVSPRPEPRATFPPRRVVIPGQGAVSVDFEERREGTTLRLRLPEEVAERAEWLLVQGAVGLPSDLSALRLATQPRHTASYEDGFMLFPHLTAGTYTLFGVRYRVGAGDGMSLHREVLQLPEASEVTREVLPRWHPLGQSNRGG